MSEDQDQESAKLPLIRASPYIVITDDYKGFPKESFCLSGHFKRDIESILIPGGFISDRIERLACDIANDIGHESFTALCVLKGGYQFFSDLLQMIRQFYRFNSFSELSPSPSSSPEHVSGSRSGTGLGSNGAVRPNTIPVSRSPQQIRAEFIRVKSYEDDSSTGKVTITGIENLSQLKGANLLVVEDIIDSGQTMVKLLSELKKLDVKSIRVASLFLKRNPKSCGYVPHYVGFEVPDKFLIGYNLDYNEYFRELNHVCVISEFAKTKYSIKNSKTEQ